ncbi:MAG: flagellin, partial [Selenomonadaceae bacterium]|nr:flagellin [Selenomonadaceae bacterium]
QSIDQINDNANVTYNGKYLVDGSHNSKVTATTTALTNESLGKDTTSATVFSAMTDHNGNSLNIQASDTITMSVVKEGKTSTFSVHGSDKLSDLVKCSGDLDDAKIDSGSTIGSDVAGDTVGTADKGNAITIHAKEGAVAGQISGLTFSVTNTKGQVQKSANAVLDNFTESIRAQNKSDDNAINLQVGTKANQSIRVGLTDMRAEALGLQSSKGETIQIGTQVQANAAVNVLDNAVQKALDQQTTIGSVQSRLSYTASNLTTASENVQASESTIRDADMAKEMTEYTKNNALMQAAQSMLAQANQSSSSVLSLLQ